MAISNTSLRRRVSASSAADTLRRDHNQENEGHYKVQAAHAEVPLHAEGGRPDEGGQAKAEHSPQ